jgi:hypothetical protein
MYGVYTVILAGKSLNIRPYIGLVRIIYVRCIYGIFGRKISRSMVRYGAQMCSVQPYVSQTHGSEISDSDLSCTIRRIRPPDSDLRLMVCSKRIRRKDSVGVYILVLECFFVALHSSPMKACKGLSRTLHTGA